MIDMNLVDIWNQSRIPNVFQFCKGGIDGEI